MYLNKKNREKIKILQNHVENCLKNDLYLGTVKIKLKLTL